jgi:hypothetical protein
MRLATALCVAGLLAAVAGAQPATPSMYEATVPLSANTERGRAQAFAEAMRQVLVQATGRAEAAQDPALASLVADAARHVQLYRQAPGRMLVVSFDARRIERLIAAADPSQVQTVTLTVAGIDGLAAYAEVSGFLESLLALRRLEVVRLSADSVVYRAVARGEPRQLALAIEQMPRLRREPSGADPVDSGTGTGSPPAGGVVLRYRYSP